MKYLILVRHGLSVWNAENKFTGWVDVPLVDFGIKQSRNCGNKIKDIPIDVIFVSELTRAKETLEEMLKIADKTVVYDYPDRKRSKDVKDTEKARVARVHWRLNERFYGILQGMDKTNVRNKYGEDLVMRWRRGYTERPPGGESLKDVYTRTEPLFDNAIMSEIKKNKTVLIVAHGNSIRGIIKYIENISDEMITSLDIPNAEPIIYEISKGKIGKRLTELSFERKVYWTKPNKLTI